MPVLNDIDELIFFITTCTLLVFDRFNIDTIFGGQFADMERPVLHVRKNQRFNQISLERNLSTAACNHGEMS